MLVRSTETLLVGSFDMTAVKHLIVPATGFLNACLEVHTRIRDLLRKSYSLSLD